MDSPDHPQSPVRVPEDLSTSGGELPSSTIQEFNDLKQETVLPSGGHTNSVPQTSSSYSFGFISPVVGSQITAVENSDSQGRDASRLPSFVVSTQYNALLYADLLSFVRLTCNILRVSNIHNALLYAELKFCMVNL